MNNQDQMKNVEVNIVNRINFLKDEIINFKGTAIRNLQDEKWEVKVLMWRIGKNMLKISVRPNCFGTAWSTEQCNIK